MKEIIVLPLLSFSILMKISPIVQNKGASQLAIRHRKGGFNFWVRKIPWSRKWQPTLVFSPGKFHGREAWWARVHEVSKSRTRLNDCAHSKQSPQDHLIHETCCLTFRIKPYVKIYILIAFAQYFIIYTSET